MRERGVLGRLKVRHDAARSERARRRRPLTSCCGSRIVLLRRLGLFVSSFIYQTHTKKKESESYLSHAEFG